MMASQPPADAPPERDGDNGTPAEEPPSTAAAEPTPFPWPPASGEPVAEAAGRTWRESVFHPSTFFRAMPRGRGVGPALLYYVTLGILVEGIHLFWRFILGPRAFGTAPGGELLQALDSGGDPLTQFLLAPVYLLVGVGLTSAVCHAILVIVRGAAHGFRTTVAVFCFAYAPALFAVIPGIGALMGGVWILVLAIIGLREAHETSGAKAAVAVLVPAFLALAIVFLIVLSLIVRTLARF